MHLNVWRVFHSHHLIGIEIALLNGAFFDADFTAEHWSQSVVDAAFDLRSNAVWVDGQTAIHCAYDALDAQRTVLDGDLGNMGYVRVSENRAGDSATVISR